MLFVEDHLHRDLIEPLQRYVIATSFSSRHVNTHAHNYSGGCHRTIFYIHHPARLVFNTTSEQQISFYPHRSV
jgi:hypothetical protein